MFLWLGSLIIKFVFFPIHRIFKDIVLYDIK
jgi:hypothetical protein